MTTAVSSTNVPSATLVHEPILLKNFSMAVTRQDLFDFTRFAEEKLTDRGTDSLKALLDEWNERRSHGQSVAGIRESVAQYEAGEWAR
jgi:hypothetical protein